MKAVSAIIFLSIGSYMFSQSNVPVGTDLPVQIEMPYQIDKESEMPIKGYSNAPNNNHNLKLYRPTFEDRTNEYVANMNKSKNIVRNNEGDALDKIIDKGKNQIDISGGYVKANEAYITEKDGTLTPKYEVYKPQVNNEEYNISIAEKKHENDIKTVKTSIEDLLPLVLIFVTIITLIYLIIFLRKKLK